LKHKEAEETGKLERANAETVGFILARGSQIIENRLFVYYRALRIICKEDRSARTHLLTKQHLDWLTVKT
jgi:hypothetical protein